MKEKQLKNLKSDQKNQYSSFSEGLINEFNPKSGKSKMFHSPLILDLNDNDVNTTGVVESPIYFNHNNNSFVEKIGLGNAKDVLLIRDLDSNSYEVSEENNLDEAGQQFTVILNCVKIGDKIKIKYGVIVKK